MEKHLIRERAWPLVYRVAFYFKQSVKRKRLCFDLSLSQILSNCNKCFYVNLVQDMQEADGLITDGFFQMPDPCHPDQFQDTAL